MPERAFAQKPEPTNIAALFPDAPTPIWSHPNYRGEGFKLAERRALSFDTRFDYRAYNKLLSEKPSLPPEEFQRRLKQLDQRTNNNLVTDLGERFNLEVSITKYKIIDGKLYNADHDEPMEDVLIRGQQYRLRNGNPIDYRREAVEVFGFQKRQSGLNSDQETFVSISPPGPEGSDYRRRFFDLDEKITKNDTTISRYTMKLSKEKLLEAARQLDPNYILPKYGEPIDVHLLENPIATSLSRAQILEILHDKEKSMSLNEFNVKVEAPTRELRKHYINRLHESAGEREIEDIRRAILKLADLSADLDTFTVDSGVALQRITDLTKNGDIALAAKELAAQKIRNVPTNCGLQEVESTDPWSVGDFGLFRDGKGTLWINCETCHAHYLRTPGILEPRCRFCSGTAGIACEPPQADSSEELAKAA